MMKEHYKQLFIEKSKKIYNKKYDYSLVEYVNAKTKVKIICPIHGIFEQYPDNHLRNHECPKCKGGTKQTNIEFIKKSTKKHKNKYDYSLVQYENNRKKVKIICPIHGIFEQSPSEHIKGGCRKCGINVTSNKKRLKITDFIERANKIHNNRYDYSNSVYRGHKHKIKIICPVHGEFEQIVNSHLNGSGCFMCKQSKGEKKIKEFLVKNNIDFIPQKRFIDCKDIRTLPFDFYLKKRNICIEYDGLQHTTLRFGKTIDDLKKIQKRDKIKSKYCDGKNGRPNLIRISHKDFKKINEILMKLLLICESTK